MKPFPVDLLLSFSGSHVLQVDFAGELSVSPCCRVIESEFRLRGNAGDCHARQCCIGVV